MSSNISSNGLDKVTKLETSENWNDHKREIDYWLIIHGMMDLIEQYPTTPYDGEAAAGNAGNAARTLIANWKKAQRQVLAAIDNRLGELARSFTLGLTIKPEHRYNMDESGIMKGFGANGLVVGSAEKRNIQMKQPGSRAWTSFLECISTTRRALDPLVIFKGKSVQQQWFPQDLTSYEGWQFT